MALQRDASVSPASAGSELSSRFANLLGMKVSALGFQECVEAVRNSALRSESGYVVAVASHTIMEGLDKPLVRDAINGAFLVVPDGMPVVKALRSMGFKRQERVTGPDLMGALCADAAENGIKIGLYGGTEECLSQLQTRLKARYPNLQIVYAFSPPFRPATDEEDQGLCKEIAESGVQILFIGLGQPKQELWTVEHQSRIKAVMVAVGAAFDFHAGIVKRAPLWVQRSGFEWLYRLGQEPKRLWRRYFKNNPRFLWHFFLQKSGLRKYPLELPSEADAK